MTKVQPKPGTLIGRAFHTFERCSRCGVQLVTHQGQVKACIQDGVYLVEYFEWFLGISSRGQLCRLGEMFAWHWYDDLDTMKRVYEHEYARQQERHAASCAEP